MSVLLFLGLQWYKNDNIHVLSIALTYTMYYDAISVSKLLILAIAEKLDFSDDLNKQALTEIKFCGTNDLKKSINGLYLG